MIADRRVRIADWKRVALGGLVENVGNWNPSRSASDETFHYIDLSAVDQDAKIITGAREVRCGEAPSRARQLVSRGDVLVSTVRPNLNGVACVPESLDGATASTGFCVLRARKPALDARYLFHWVKSPAFVSDMVKKATGASYPAVSDQIVLDSLIPLPSLAEQRRIAEVLDRAEALRAKRRAALAQLDSLTQSLFLDLFGDLAINTKGWRVDMLGSLFSVKHGFAFKSEYFADDGDFVLLTPGNFCEAGGYRDRGEKQKFYVGPIPDGYILEANDLLIAMTEQAPGLLGSPVLIPRSNRFLHNQRLGLVKLKSAAEKLFLFHLFSSPFVRIQIQANSTGTKVKHTSPGKITAVRVPIPPLPLQREFARRVAAVEKLKAAQRASLAELDALFASLQHRAFRGEL